MLKVLVLRKKIDTAKKQLEALRAKDAEFQTREAEIEKAINEAAEMEGTEEEIAEAQRTVEEEAEKFDAEKKEHDAEAAKLENDISEMEQELAEAEKEQDTTPVPAEPEKPAEAAEERKNERRNNMIKRTIFDRLTMQERSAMFDREDVKNFMSNFRSYLAKEKRDIQGGALLIPEVFVGLLKENIIDYSKLYRHVNLQTIGGKGRQIVQGTVSEAVWTECCAVLNEMNLAFNDVEVDCYKVGAYFKVCNAVLEDSDIDLAATLLDAMGQAIGKALDKAILYGRNAAGTQKMPMGIVTRLAQTSKPSDYPVTARPWVDLHSTNIVALTAGLTGAALIAAIVEASGKAKSSYSRGEKVWVMNETTYTKLMAATVSVDAAGRVVSGVSDRMPVVGGIIEVLNFLPDNVIIGGYFDLYLLAERAGNQFAESEHAFFIQDQTCFKGTARYDGQPVIAEGFVAIGLEGTTPNATMPFAPDNANTVTAILTNSSAVTLDPTDTFQIIAKTLPVDGPVTYESSATSYATVSADGLITAVAQGSATITITSGSATATVAVTVTAGA